MSGADDEVPKLPRGRGMKLDRAMLVRIALTGLLLAMLVLSTRHCANATSSFVMGFGDDGSAADKMPKPGTVDVPRQGPGSAADYELIKPGMTEAEIKAAIERQKQKQAPAPDPTPPASRP